MSGIFISNKTQAIFLYAPSAAALIFALRSITGRSLRGDGCAGAVLFNWSGVVAWCGEIGDDKAANLAVSPSETSAAVLVRRA